MYKPGWPSFPKIPMLEAMQSTLRYLVSAHEQLFFYYIPWVHSLHLWVLWYHVDSIHPAMIFITSMCVCVCVCVSVWCVCVVWDITSYRMTAYTILLYPTVWSHSPQRACHHDWGWADTDTTDHWHRLQFSNYWYALARLMEDHVPYSVIQYLKRQFFDSSRTCFTWCSCLKPQHTNTLLLQHECQWAKASSVQDSGSETEHIISKQTLQYCSFSTTFRVLFSFSFN